MPSPFPGMDPFIESQAWEDFHSRAIIAISDILQPSIRGRYTSWVERRVYVEHPDPDDSQSELRIADVAVVPHPFPRGTSAGGAIASLEPASGQLVMPEERREAYLVIRKHDTTEVVTIVELLSPSNKKPGGDGRAQYLAKRDTIVNTRTHLVEIDLLRGGSRLPMRTPLPPKEYLTIVSRGYRRPSAEIYAWPLTDRLPIIPIPLAGNDPDVPLDLQAVLDTVYDRGAYDEKLDYSVPLHPPAGEATQQWVKRTLERAHPPATDTNAT